MGTSTHNTHTHTHTHTSHTHNTLKHQNTNTMTQKTVHKSHTNLDIGTHTQQNPHFRGHVYQKRYTHKPAKSVQAATATQTHCIMIMKIFIKHETLSVGTILSVYMHTNTHTGTCTHEQTDYRKLNLHAT